MRTKLRKGLFVVGLTIVASMALKEPSNVSANQEDAFEIVWNGASLKGDEGNYNWFVEGGALKIQGTGEMGDFLDHTDNNPPWYDHRKEITQVEISEGITKIGRGAFYEFENLKEISIPDSVTIIADIAFSHSGLTKVTIPDNVVSIGEQAFYENANLTEIEFGENVESIGGRALSRTGLKTVKLPEKLTIVESGLFEMCEDLEQVIFNDGLKEIKDYAFYHTILQSADLPNTVESIGRNAFDSTKLNSLKTPQNLKVIDFNAFIACDNLSTVTLNEGLKYLGDDSFKWCPITEITLPASMEECIFALDMCTELEHINVSKENPIFYSQDGVLFRYDNNQMELYPVAKKDTSYSIPEGTKSLGYKCFSRYLPNLKNLEEIIIPHSVTWIPEYTFESLPQDISVYYKGTEEEWKQIYDDYGSPYSDISERVIFLGNEGGNESEDAKLQVATSETLIRENSDSIQYEIAVTVYNESNITANNITCTFEGEKQETYKVINENAEPISKLNENEYGRFTYTVEIDRNYYKEGGNFIYDILITTDRGLEILQYDEFYIYPFNSVDKRLKFPDDVWGFKNFAVKYNEMEYKYADALVYKLPPSYKKYITDKISAEEGALCYGMSLTAILNKVDALDKYSGNLGEIKEYNYDIKSYLIYNSLSQYLPDVKKSMQVYKMLPKKVKATKLINLVERVKDGDPPVLIGMSGMSGHAVVGFDVERNGSFYSPFSDKCYDTKIYVYDSNDPDEIKIGSILINEETGEWESSNYDHKYDTFSMAENDIDILNPDYTVNNFNIRNEIQIKSRKRMMIKQGKYQFCVNNNKIIDGQENIVSYYDLGGESEGGLNIILPLENENVVISTDGQEINEIAFSELGGDIYRSVNAKNAEKVELGKNGDVSILGNDGNFEIVIAKDDYSNKTMHTYSVIGGSGCKGKISIKPTSTGIAISGDDLSGLSVKGENDVTEKTIKIPNDENISDVLIDGSNGELDIVAQNDEWVDLGDGNWGYIRNGERVVSDWISITEADPYNNNEVGEVWYHFGADGLMQRGWIIDETGWKVYLLDSNGRMMHSNWVNAPKNIELNRPAGIYHLTDDGAVQMNGWALAKNSQTIYWYCNPGTGLFEKNNPGSWSGKKLW